MYVCTVLVLLKFGILNFIGYFVNIRQLNGDVNLPIVVVSFALCAFTAGAAVWALVGDKTGRIAFMVLTPLNVLWPILLVVSPFLGEDQEQARNAMVFIIGQVFLSFWVIGIEWYFMTKKVVDYYKQNV